MFQKLKATNLSKKWVSIVSTQPATANDIKLLFSSNTQLDFIFKIPEWQTVVENCYIAYHENGILQ